MNSYAANNQWKSVWTKVYNWCSKETDLEASSGKHGSGGWHAGR